MVVSSIRRSPRREQLKNHFDRFREDPIPRLYRRSHDRTGTHPIAGCRAPHRREDADVGEVALFGKGAARLAPGLADARDLPGKRSRVLSRALAAGLEPMKPEVRA